MKEREEAGLPGVGCFPPAGRELVGPWADNALIAKREFTANGRQWYEIGIRDQIGNYDIYQVYYLSSDGVLDAHIYSKGLQCVVDHVHYPNWRIDFDIQGSSNGQILQNTVSGYETKSIEFNTNKPSRQPWLACSGFGYEKLRRCVARLR